MRWIATPAFGVLLGTAVISALIGVLLWRRRGVPGGILLLSLVMFAVAEWALVAGLEAAAVGLSSKVLWSKLEYLGSTCTATLLLLFALRHTGRIDRVRLRWLLWLLPSIALPLVFTNDWHGLHWTGFPAGPAGTNLVVYQHGPVFFVILAALYAYVLSAAGLLIRDALQAGIARRRQAFAVLTAGLFPVIGGLLYAVNSSLFAGVNITPMSFAASGAVLAISIVSFRYFDVVPIARDTLIEQMIDCVVVLNATNHVVDANPAARRLLQLGNGTIGLPVEQALSAWPGIVSRCQATSPRQTQIRLSEAPLRFVHVQITPLVTKGAAFSGRLIVLRDVTSGHLAELKLQEANARLQTRLEEIRSLQERMRDQAIRDSLTGLFNRRYLEETLPRELATASRRGTTVSVILLDVDRFKRINDTAGHRAGDETLLRLARILESQTRKGDIACRYGGDEFVVVLPDTRLDAAVGRAEELRTTHRADAEAHRIPWGTLSLGVACSPEHGEDADALLQSADRALYQAKNSGRDCVRGAASR